MKASTYLLLIFCCLLIACGSGGSPEEALTGTSNCSLAGQVCKNSDTTPEKTSPALSLSLEIDGQSTLRIEENSTASLKLLATNSDGTAIIDTPVTFTAENVLLNSDSALTDNQGIATVTVTANTNELGVATASASMVINDETLSVQIHYQIIAAKTAPPKSDPSLALTLEINNQSTITLEEGQTATLKAALQDGQGNPITESVVFFSSDFGSLNSNGGFTDQNGTATVELTAPTGTLGIATATAAATVNETTYLSELTYQVINGTASAPIQSLRLGYFDENNHFIEGKIKAQLETVSAGGSVGLEVFIVDQHHNPILQPVQLELTSPCINANQSSIDTPVTTVSGEAKSTYKDISCAGLEGNTDTIVATVTSGSTTLTANAQIALTPEQLGSIEFISAIPESINLKGTGSIGRQETATLTFRVRGELGNPLAQQKVNFGLSTHAGGLRLSSTDGTTDANGLVGTQVISGTVPTTATVTISAERKGATIYSNSSLLSINTGLPDQAGFTLSPTVLNPEAFNIVGENILITARLTDNHRNPVPDGTAVSFTAESGKIDGACTTVNGLCSVNWSSQGAFIHNHRVTILATAEGHEYFKDTNGDGIYSLNQDGGTFSIPGSSLHLNAIYSGAGNMGGLFSLFDQHRKAYPDTTFGFVDMPDAWLDANENHQFDRSERLINQGQGEWSAGDALFTGKPLCQHQDDNSECSASAFSRLRKSTVIITSSSKAHYELRNLDNNAVIISTLNTPASVPLSINRGESIRLQLDVCDTAYQVMPFNTSIEITSDVGKTSGITSLSVPNERSHIINPTQDQCGINGHRMAFSLTNNLELGDDDTNKVGTLVLNIKTPNGTPTDSQVEVIFKK